MDLAASSSTFLIREQNTVPSSKLVVTKAADALLVCHPVGRNLTDYENAYYMGFSLLGMPFRALISPILLSLDSSDCITT